MAVWALADLHLSFGTPNKEMDIFGKQWIGYTDKVKNNWLTHITNDDLVLIAGDISWAMRIEEVVPDLEWIHQLPGTKVILRGNHDFWWASLKKIEKVLPSTIHLIQNNAFHWKDIAVGGTRLWDTSEYKFNSYVEYQDNPKARVLTEHETDSKETERIFQRELARLEMSLKCLKPQAKTRIAMIHYPPIGADLKDSLTSKILEKYNINICVFGHLHNINHPLVFGEKNGVRYHLTSCDYLNFMPLKVLE